MIFAITAWTTERPRLRLFGNSLTKCLMVSGVCNECGVMVLPVSLENTRNEFRARIESFQKAWALVGHDLKKHGKI